jgi:hypothetical protein
VDSPLGGRVGPQEEWVTKSVLNRGEVTRGYAHLSSRVKLGQARGRVSLGFTYRLPRPPSPGQETPMPHPTH